MHTGRGRTIPRRQRAPLIVPDDLAVLTCTTNGCGAMLFDAANLDAIASANGFPAATAASTKRTAVFRIDGMNLVNSANTREHWSTKRRRNEAEKSAAWSHTLTALARRTFQRPMRIAIVRFGDLAMDSDGVATSAKYVRDGIAQALGFDDGDLLLDWRYHGLRGPHGVHVTITELDAPPELPAGLPAAPPTMSAAQRALRTLHPSTKARRRR
ncbi:MAG: hypothetical protein ACHREM_00035 [Polyangiales bacterium]